MARTFLTALNLAKNELQNAVVQNLASAPAAPVKGQLYFNSTGGDNTLYWYDGTAWIPAKASSTLPLSNSASTAAIGDAPSGGAASDASRGDHKHGMPGFGGAIAATTFGLAKVDGSQVTPARSDHHHGTPTHDNAAHSAIKLNALAVPDGPVSMNGQKVTSVGTPTAGTDAVTKDYADNLSAGLSWKEACRIATTGNVTQSGLAAIDGVTPVANDRILCKDQSTGSQNGIWLAQSGAWSRATDADAVGELEGATVFVMEGTANADKAFTCTTNAPITPGTTATVWVQFGAGTSYTAGAGLTLTGSTFDVVAANGSIAVAADNIQVGYAGTGGDNGAAATAARSDHAHSTLYPPVTRTINTTAPLTGGGDLSANRTLAVSAATESAAGVVELATIAEVNAGTDATRAVTPAGLNDVLIGNSNIPYTRKSDGWIAGGATSEVVTHDLGTRNVVVDVYRDSTPWDTVECDVERTTVNTLTLRFSVAPAANAYRFVVVG